MISRDKKFIFIHINKTGGTSIKKAFNKYGYEHENIIRSSRTLKGRIRTAHWTYDEYKTHCEKSFDFFFKFTVVRNPWDRVVSWYEYSRSTATGHDHFLSINTDTQLQIKSSGLSDRAWQLRNQIQSKNNRLRRDRQAERQMFKDNLSFKEWVVANYNINNSDRMFKPCTYWLGDDMDFIARFENLDKDFKKICKVLNVEHELGHHRYNGSRERKPYQKYYDDETREIIRECLKEDIDAFNYEF